MDYIVRAVKANPPFGISRRREEVELEPWGSFKVRQGCLL